MNCTVLFSVIIPVYNRPNELRELLESLTQQEFGEFEVLVVDDGSELRSDKVAAEFKEKLDLRYYYKPNSGQGFSRNFGFERANGRYLVVFDSDCIVPPHYFELVRRRLEEEPADLWGGPDRAHPSFTAVQKAISFSMTSLLSTGGIRGSRQAARKFHPRSFNMGISREVFEKTGGYKITRMGEDIEFSIRIMKMGFRKIYIDDAFVYHKRRVSLYQFYRQIYFFGRARVNISRFWPEELRPIHLMPLLYLLVPLIAVAILPITALPLKLIVICYAIYNSALFLEAVCSERNVVVSLLALFAVNIQHLAYGVGFIREYWSRKQNEL